MPPDRQRTRSLARPFGVLVLIACLVATGAAQELRRARPSLDQRRDAPAVLELFSEVSLQASQCTVTLRLGKRDVALGTIVSADGYLLSKASELVQGAPREGSPEPALTCRLHDGRRLAAEIVALDEEFDLALLHVDARGLTPVRWSASDVRVGRLVVSAGPAGKALAVGIVGVAPKPIAGNSGYLGVSLGEGARGGVAVVRVLDGTPADSAGLFAGDILLSIDGNAVNRRDQAVDAIRARAAGAKLLLALRRGDEQLELEATLVARESTTTSRRRRNSARLEGEQSERRAGFPSALQHDTVLAPERCGGPLLGLDGTAVGLNIARAGRVSTYALPASALRPRVAQLLAEARAYMRGERAP